MAKTENKNGTATMERPEQEASATPDSRAAATPIKFTQIGPPLSAPNGAREYHSAAVVRGGTIYRIRVEHTNGMTKMVSLSDAMVFIPD